MTRSVHTVVIVVLLMSATCYAGEWSFGVLGRLNSAESPYDWPEGFSWEFEDERRATFGAGAFVAYEFGDSGMWALESGVVYQRRGGYTDSEYVVTGPDSPEPIDTGTYRYTWELAYFSVPLVARASFGTGNVRPYAKLGPEVSKLYWAELTGEDLDCNGLPSSREDVKDWLTDLDWGATAAAGLEFPIGGSSGFVEIGYSHGFTDIMDPADVEIDVTLYNRVLSLTAGVGF
jgi:hypothetical protein